MTPEVVAVMSVRVRDNAGNILVPLTAAQLLWINVLADGPPALALDRNPDVMKWAPRRPTEPLLDRASLRFVLITGAAKAAIGLGLLVVLPQIDYTALEPRSAVFVYETVASSRSSTQRAACTAMPSPTGPST